MVLGESYKAVFSGSARVKNRYFIAATLKDFDGNWTDGGKSIVIGRNKVSNGFHINKMLMGQREQWKVEIRDVGSKGNIVGRKTPKMERTDELAVKKGEKTGEQ